MEWTFHPYVEIAKLYAVPIPLQFRLKVLRIRGASVGITKKVSSTESEKYHYVLHVHDSHQMYKYVDIRIIYKVYDYAYLFPRPWEPRYRCLVHLNQINTSKVTVKNVFLHNGGSSFA